MIEALVHAGGGAHREQRWCVAWRESMPAIGLRPNATEEEAEAALCRMVGCEWQTLRAHAKP